MTDKEMNVLGNCASFMEMAMEFMNRQDPWQTEDVAELQNQAEATINWIRHFIRETTKTNPPTTQID